jgi:4-hydroxybenzoate polyprenyltransferase
VYQKDLYTNIIISIAIALTHKKFHGLQTNRLHELFYILQVALLLLAIVNVNWLMLITCIGLTLILVTSAFYRQASFSFVNNQVLDFAVDLLNLDKNERDLATSLLYIQNGVVHTYPLTALHGLVKFFLP